MHGKGCVRVFDAIDRYSSDEIKTLQGELLTETVRYAYEHSPYYKKRFDELGLHPLHMKGMESIEEMPFTTKEDVQRDTWGFLAVPKQDIAEIVSTTGTTGDPAFIALTHNDLERLAWNEEKSFRYAGVVKGDLFHIAVTCDNLFIAGIAYYRGLINLGASVARIGPQNTIRYLDLIRKLKPTGIVAVPSLILQKLCRAGENGISVKDLGLEKIVLIGDTVRNADFSTNRLGSLIENAFGRICYSTYGITEAHLSFCECQVHRGLHSHPDLVLVEIVDDNGRTLSDGEVGELVLTPFQIEGMPLIRYKTGDITFKMSEPCPCGRNSVRIGPILGRKHHKLKVKGVTLYPQTIGNALLDVKEVINYQIEAYTGDDQTDHILLWIGSYNTRRDFLASLHDAIHARARITPTVKIERPEEVEKRLFEGGSRKAITFKDRRIKLYE
ncbi:MAG: phenylacetate-CoA ligase [Candidatus Brocadia fulgida]|jgi:Coenzyme F390 synthetase|uniref:Phenylacetate-CoA ligase n=1 Tax=Candidatus Brocadia fulgida TaxID=380242 RepID=A0A0M2UTQ3_9BACT|nr:MAG: phenylacetate-CoA ligase [Candidatus Brocadia fulgida]